VAGFGQLAAVEADRRQGASKVENYSRGPWQEGLRNSALYITPVALQCKCILARCGRYARQHNTSECTGDPPKKCTNCKADHEAWNGACSVKRIQQEKAAAIRAYTLTHYAGTYKAPTSGQQLQSQYEITTKEVSQRAKKRKLKETATQESFT